MFAFTLLLRNWRSGELKLLSVSILLAVAVLSGISIFADRLESTLLNQSNNLLGADKIVSSSKDFPQEWIAEANQAQIKQSQAISFRSMVYAGDEMHLAGVKAVTGTYPLRGQLEISQVPFTMNPAEIKVADGIPAPGEAWVDSRLLPALKISVGDKLAVGELELTVTQALIREPEALNPFGALAPRVLMNMVDVPATQVLKEGSNVTYTWLLAQDNPQTLDDFIAWLKPQLSKHEKIQDISSGQERLANTLDTGKNFLVLAAVIAVLLAGVAIAIAARQFSERHVNQVALMKSLGTSATKIRALYFGQLFILAVLASLIGLVAGYAIQYVVAIAIQNTYQLDLLSPHLLPFFLSMASGLLCVTFFALPALWFLPGVPPLKILRRELAVNKAQLSLQAGLAFLAVIFLVGIFSADIKLTLSVSLALASIVLVACLFSLGLLRLSKLLVVRFGGAWRLAFSSLQHRKGQSLVQIMVFAIAIMLLLVLTIIRTSLIDDWQKQLPEKAPNHFLVNIPPAELDDVKTMLQEQQLLDIPLYPMIRGRLLTINGKEPSEEAIKKADALQREVNLTQADSLAADNKILEGEWWDKWKRKSIAGVSVESDTAKKLDIHIGDELRFSLGGLNLDAKVASIRSVEWKSMRPNFFFIFEPGAMDNYSPTFMTSVYLPAEKKTFISQLLHKHPTILVMEFDRVIDQMRKIINQVSDGIALVLWLTLAAGGLVLLAAVVSSIDSRKQEAGLLRALGSSRQLMLGSVFAEFILLGFLAGVIAIVGAEVLLFNLQKFVLHTPIQPHYFYWALSPLASAILISTLGVVACRHVVTTPPAVVLREAA